MAIIYSYPTVTPASGDLIVGTDITGKVTKNFTVGSIVSTEIPTYIIGTTNSVPLFTSANTIGNSIITQDSGANGVGIGGDAENNRKLKVHGNSSVDGNLYLSGDASSYSVEVGQSRSVEGVALLDLTGEIMPDDYGLRLIRYGGENAESAIIHTGTSNLRIRTENAADTVFENTNVGIGTVSPGVPLEVNGVNTTSGQGEGLRVTKPGVSSQYISIDEADGSKHRIRAIGNKPFEIFSNSSSYGINFSTNSTERMRIDSSGNVGIGTISPLAKLNIDGVVKIEGENPLWFGGGSGIPTWQINASGSNLVIDDIIGNSGDLIFSGQNIGIGTTSPNEKLTINSGRMLVTGNNTPIYIKVSSNYKSWVHHISSDDGYIFAPSTADGGETWDWANQTKLGANGVVIAKNFELSADERLYDNVEDIEDNVIVAFKSFEIESSPGEKRYGVIAQELEINNPELVTTDAYGFKSVKYIDLLIAKIAELENRIQTLENE